MWKGTISFGLVTIPVKLYAATEEKELSFHLLHEPCRSRVQYKKWCPACDREVAQNEIVRGFELDPKRYVILTDEDFESIPLVAARTLEIVDFVRLDQIDPIYYDRTYYLEPGDGGAKAYALLRTAMEQTGRIAVARVVIRSKESLAAIRVFAGGVLALETMHFPDEIRPAAGLTGVSAPALRPAELEMAVNLVGSLSGDFAPEKFQNEYRDALFALIQSKAAGQAVEAAPAPQPGKVADLMEALQASIRLAEQSRGTAKVVPAAASSPDIPPERRADAPPERPPAVPTAPPPPAMPAGVIGQSAPDPALHPGGPL